MEGHAMPENQDEPRTAIFLKARHVRERYRVSHMWIERRQRDADFPAPVYFGGMRFWKLSDLERWELSQAARPKARLTRGLKSNAEVAS
jgi:predicted DNA-binding transcriptional regulator AlpA